MGMIFQNFNLFEQRNVLKNVLYPLELAKVEKTKAMNKALELLEIVGLSDKVNSYPSQLSGGQKQRVAIARAIATQPKYLFCDEPNSGLDPQTSIVIDQLIKEITHEYNITTVVNTHDMNSVMEIGENINYIHQGQLWWKGSNENVLNSENQELNDFIFCSALTKRLKL